MVETPEKPPATWTGGGGPSKSALCWAMVMMRESQGFRGVASTTSTRASLSCRVPLMRRMPPSWTLSVPSSTARSPSTTTSPPSLTLNTESVLLTLPSTTHSPPSPTVTEDPLKSNTADEADDESPTVTEEPSPTASVAPWKLLDEELRETEAPEATVMLAPAREDPAIDTLAPDDTKTLESAPSTTTEVTEESAASVVEPPAATVTVPVSNTSAGSSRNDRRDCDSTTQVPRVAPSSSSSQSPGVRAPKEKVPLAAVRVVSTTPSPDVSVTSRASEEPSTSPESTAGNTSAQAGSS